MAPICQIGQERHPPENMYSVWCIDTSGPSGLYRLKHYVHGEEQPNPLVKTGTELPFELRTIKKREPDAVIVPLRFGDYYPTQLEKLLKEVEEYQT